MRGRRWWLRYTPAAGAKQLRVPLDTEFEEVAAMTALAILQQGPIEAPGEFEKALDDYLEDSVKKDLLSKQGARNRRYVLMDFAKTFGVTSLSMLSVKRVEVWVGWLKGGHGGEGVVKRSKPISAGTAAAYLFHMRAFCGWLVEKKKARENVASKIRLGKVEYVARKTFLPGETVRKLIDSAPDDDMRFILYCGFHVGMRKLEIVEARPNWFRMGHAGRRGVVNVHRTPTFSCKDRDERNIPMSREFETFLRGYLARLPEDAEFVLKPRKRHGKHRYRYDFRKPFASYLKENGIRKITPHDMRRTFVSLKLIEDSSLIFKVAKWTGDLASVIQKHYGHLLADDEDIEAGL